MCYSTASSAVDRPKFRLVFNLVETVHRDRIPHFWYALNTEIGDIGDAQTKDLGRMYYVPANYDGAYNFIFCNSGSPIDVDYLVAKHPYKERIGNSFLDRLPPELQKVVVEHRKNQTTNTNFSWTDYRDCPFWLHVCLPVNTKPSMRRDGIVNSIRSWLPLLAMQSRQGTQYPHGKSQIYVHNLTWTTENGMITDH